MMFGFWSKLSCLVCWIFALSQHRRLSNCVVYGGDRLRCQLLFWALFAPLAHAWSVDAYLQCQRKKQMEGPARQESLACDFCLPQLCPTKQVSSDHEKDKRLRNTAAPLSAFLILLQLSSMYQYTGSTKVGETWMNGEAVLRTLRCSQIAREPFAGWIAMFPLMCSLLTWATLYVEKYGWLLAFLPSQLCRSTAFCMFFGLHFGLYSFLRIGHFQLFAISGWCVALPRSFLDFLEASLHHRWPQSSQVLVTYSDPEVTGVRRSCGLATTIMLNAVGFSLMYLAVAQGCKHHPGCLAPFRFDFGNKEMVSNLGLKQNWAMFSPNPPGTSFYVQLYGILGSPKCDVNMPNYAAECHVVNLWTDKGFPEATPSLLHLPTWSHLPAPVPTRVDFATNRWMSLVEKTQRSKGLGKWMCQQWKATHNGKPELLGMFLVSGKSEASGKSELKDMKETFSLTFRVSCHSDYEHLIEGLPLPPWLR